MNASRKWLNASWLMGAVAILATSAFATDYATEVLALNPKVYLRFEDADSADGAVASNSAGSGAAYDGVYTNGCTLVAGPYSSGITGKALNVTNLGAYVHLSNASFPTGTTERTVLAWIKHPTNAITSFEGIFDYGSSGTYGKSFLLYGATDPGFPNGRICISQWGSAVWGPSVSDNQWHFVAITMTPTTPAGYAMINLYYDGVLYDSISMEVNTALGVEARIGKFTDAVIDAVGGTNWNGSIDEVAIFTNALSATQIYRLYTVSPDSGTITTNGADRIYTFKRSGEFVVPPGVHNCEVLVVAGGGAGGGYIGGGGGGGGVVYTSSYSVAGTVAVTVGDGGSTTNGGNSAFGTLAAFGGGNGSSGAGMYTRYPSIGGSGGGGGSLNGAYSNGAAGIAGQGYAGGSSAGQVANYGSGGGGGAGGIGEFGNSSYGGNGGAGFVSSISGSSVTYGGGGGGSIGVANAGLGGVGGGGKASLHDGTGVCITNGLAGTANTGGGGGGGGRRNDYYAQWFGGSGIVIVKYTLPAVGTIIKIR